MAYSPYIPYTAFFFLLAFVIYALVGAWTVGHPHVIRLACDKGD